MKGFIVPLVALSLLVLAQASAEAQITQRAQPKTSPASAAQPDFVVTDEKRGTYAVEFGEDGLDASLEDGTIPRIVVRPVHLFGQLVRPRTHFVPELLKSVEIM